jgi:predicted nuclease with TOPRIM domain
MLRHLPVLLLAAATFAGPAIAQTGSPPAGGPAVDAGKAVVPAPPGPPSRRYRFSHVEDGVLRLDNETGQVLLCKPVGGAWNCKEVPERQAALDGEIEQLKTRNEALQRQFEAGQQKTAADINKRAALAEKITALHTEHGALKTRIDDLKSQVVALENLMGAQTERDAQKAEIAGLKSANDALNKQLLAIKAQTETLQKQIAELTPPPPPSPADGAAAKSGDIKKPLREDLEHARAVLEEAWRRVVEMIGNLQKDMLRKG